MIFYIHRDFIGDGKWQNFKFVHQRPSSVRRFSFGLYHPTVRYKSPEKCEKY